MQSNHDKILTPDPLSSPASEQKGGALPHQSITENVTHYYAFLNKSHNEIKTFIKSSTDITRIHSAISILKEEGLSTSDLLIKAQAAIILAGKHAHIVVHALIRADNAGIFTDLTCVLLYTAGEKALEVADNLVALKKNRLFNDENSFYSSQVLDTILNQLLLLNIDEWLDRTQKIVKACGKIDKHLLDHRYVINGFKSLLTETTIELTEHRIEKFSFYHNSPNYLCNVLLFLNTAKILTDQTFHLMISVNYNYYRRTDLLDILSKLHENNISITPEAFIMIAQSRHESLAQTKAFIKNLKQLESNAIPLTNELVALSYMISGQNPSIIDIIDIIISTHLEIQNLAALNIIAEIILSLHDPADYQCARIISDSMIPLIKEKIPLEEVKTIFMFQDERIFAPKQVSDLLLSLNDYKAPLTKKILRAISNLCQHSFLSFFVWKELFALENLIRLFQEALLLFKEEGFPMNEEIILFILLANLSSQAKSTISGFCVTGSTSRLLSKNNA